MRNFEYPVRLESDKRGVVTVTFADLPGVTEGEGESEALQRAVDALETVLASYVRDGRDLPVPSRTKKGTRVTRPSPLSCMKLAAYQEMRHRRMGKAELARRLGWHLPQVDRVLDLRHASKIDQVEAVLSALGLVLRVEIDKAA